MNGQEEMNEGGGRFRVPDEREGRLRRSAGVALVLVALGAALLAGPATH